MSVVVIGRFPVADVATARQAIASQAALIEEISEDSKKLGCEHHHTGKAMVSWSSSTSGRVPKAFNGSLKGTPRSSRSSNRSESRGPRTSRSSG